MMSPGQTEYPEHRIETVPMKERVEVFIKGEKVAETIRAIKLLEPGYPPRIYIPRDDIHGIELIKFDDYQCPFKGHGELYRVKHGSSVFDNAAWSYLRPYDDVLEIKNFVAFYPEKVQLIRVTG